MNETEKQHDEIAAAFDSLKEDMPAFEELLSSGLAELNNPATRNKTADTSTLIAVLASQISVLNNRLLKVESNETKNK